jgi:hypothetical protein
MKFSVTRWRSIRLACGCLAVAAEAVAVVAMLSGSASARTPVAAGCMRLGLSRPYAFSHLSITVQPGVIVWAIEADNEPGLVGPGRRPNTWLRLPVQSSDNRVLTPVALCAHNPHTHGYDERLYAFRAVRAGRATLSAALAPAWRRVTGPPKPFRATVTVAP